MVIFCEPSTTYVLGRTVGRVKTVEISVIDGANSEIGLYLDIKLYNPVLM